MSEKYYHKPLVLTYSGGKDSDVMLRLAQKSGINFEIINNHTTVDAPCTVRYIREVFKNIERTGKKATILYPKLSMWQLIVKNGTPPSRISRYCCKELKEKNIPNRYIATGVRQAESSNRKDRTEFETRGKTKADAKHYDIEHTKNVFNDAIKVQEEQGLKDNDIDVYDCNLITACKKNNDVIVNPIIDWTDSDIWDFIHDENMTINPIYEHFDRCGCILCPMSGYCQKMKQIDLFPQYKQMYINAFDKMIEKRLEKGLDTSWKNGADCFDWWIERYKHEVKGQMSLDFSKGAEHED